MADSYSYRRDHTEISRSSHFSTYSNNSSFSSSLLEEIYRSIDLDRGEEVVVSMRTKRDDDAKVRSAVLKSEEEMANHKRACMIEKWMEKKVTGKIVGRGKSMADFQMLSTDRQGSSSSSSDSSCSGGGGGGGFFSSSEGESFSVIHRPKSVRTGGELGKSRRNSEPDRRERRSFGDELEEKSKRESGFLKTKSRAMKIYDDLKKAKQPISPGGKVAAFLNSLFAAGNLRKHKISAACGGGHRDSPSLKSTNTSCSSASSFSRSCLSKTSSKSPGGGKRSVRFSPVVGEEKKSLHQGDNEKNKNVDLIKTAIDEELMAQIMEKNRRVEEAARDFLMYYQKRDQILEYDEEEDEDYDAASYASSDLFELDNLSAIGMERYREELPVYDTTDLDQIQIMQMG